MDFKVKVSDIEEGQNEVLLNEIQAHQLGLEVMDRAVVRKGDKSAVAIVKHSNTFVAQGEAGVFHELSRSLAISEGDIISVELAPRPASLDYIRKKLDNQLLAPSEISSIIGD